MFSGSPQIAVFLFPFLPCTNQFNPKRRIFYIDRLAIKCKTLYSYINPIIYNILLFFLRANTTLVWWSILSTFLIAMVMVLLLSR